MITFKLRRDWHEALFARRIAGIVTGNLDSRFEPYKTDGKWVLDSHNDWFLRRQDDGSWQLRYRYGEAYPDKFWQGLQAVIETLIDK
jgi:hypothetical protein